MHPLSGLRRRRLVPHAPALGALAVMPAQIHESVLSRVKTELLDINDHGLTPP